MARSKKTSVRGRPRQSDTRGLVIPRGVSLFQDQILALERIAKLRGRSFSLCVQAAVDQFVKRELAKIERSKGRKR